MVYRLYRPATRAYPIIVYFSTVAGCWGDVQSNDPFCVTCAAVAA